MIQQRPGDVLEVEFENKFYYLLVITKIFMFGGNIIYAFHGNGEKIENFTCSSALPGFNICTDLLLPKKEGTVKRIAKIETPKSYLVSKYIKGCNEYRTGKKAAEWWICSVENPNEDIARVPKLSEEYAKAMDGGMCSFDLTANKILNSYTSDKNPFI
jgi:hypothetical protein